MKQICRQTLGVALAALVFGTLSQSAEKYTGPRPPQKDMLYLVHADNLIPTELVEATDAGSKDGATFGIKGTTSPARTPLAEPIFLLASDKLFPDHLELYQLTTKNGRREITLNNKKRKNGARPYPLTVKELDTNLFRIEAGEALENGEYSVSPSGVNTAFCFTVY